MSKKFDDFMEELKTLCIKHKVIIASSGYDPILIWDMGALDEPVISASSVQDMTASNHE